MKTPIGKHFMRFLLVFPITLILIAGLLAAGKMSPREMGYALVAVCFTAIIILTLLLDKTTREARSATQPFEIGDGPTTRKKVQRSIRTCRVAIAAMPVIFVYALWAPGTAH